jgi:hypothetical protein
MVTKVAGRATSTKRPPTMPPMPMPRLRRVKLIPKYRWRCSLGTIEPMSELEAGHTTPNP